MYGDCNVLMHIDEPKDFQVTFQGAIYNILLWSNINFEGKCKLLKTLINWEISSSAFPLTIHNLPLITIGLLAP
jgi:hypothetical protein